MMAVGKYYDYMLVNPKIVSHSVQEAYLPTGEGCLSVDDNVAESSSPS